LTIAPADDLPAAVASLAAGDTLLLKAGVYNSICFRTPVKGVTIKAQYPGRAWIRPKPPYECGVYADDRMACSDITIDGLDVTAPIDGIRFMHGQRITVRNCHVHHTGNMGLALHYCDGTTVEGCLIEDCGSGYESVSGVRQQHGMYLSGDLVTVRNNLIRNNSGWGVHLWPYATRSVVANNLILNHPRGSGIVYRRDPADADPANGNRVHRNMVSNALNGVQAVCGIGDVIADNTCVGCIWAVNLQKPAGRVYLDANIGGPTYNPSGRGVLLPPATQPVSRAGAWRGITSQPAEAPASQPAEEP